MLQKIINSIKESENSGLAFEIDSNVLSGFSGYKLIGTLQRLASLYEDDKNACYLEIGVFQGLTLLSVATACPRLTCYGIDNFAYFDPKGKNLSIVEQRSEKLGVDNKVLINKDYEDALEFLNEDLSNKKVGVYFIDGPHDYRSQLMCLELALPYLHHNSVIVVDDCNYPHVRQANRDFLVTHPEFKLVFEAYTKCHPNNMSVVQKEEARRGWWNGVNIIARDSQNLLKYLYPPTERNRLLYENEHELHASRLAELAPQSLQLLNYIHGKKILKSISTTINLYKELSRNNSRYGKRFENLNTFSENLSDSQYNILQNEGGN